MQDTLRFADFLHKRPEAKGIDVLCGLQHFAIITYAVDPSKVANLMPSRFSLDTVDIDGSERALMSVVPFIDIDFTSAVYPFPKFTMGQTNYRIYIRDRETNEKCVWFIGTTLDSWTVTVPRYLWRLPWHSGTVEFDCTVDEETQTYSRYSMSTKAKWAPAEVRLSQEPGQVLDLPGFPDLETGLVYLTHPLAGFYHRRDGKLGTYRVWHDRLDVKPATLEFASFGLLSRLGILSEREQQSPHSVLLEPLNEFTIYLPPTVIV